MKRFLPIWIYGWLGKNKRNFITWKKKLYSHKTHIKRVSKNFEINNLREYYGLYVQSDALMLADVFQNFQKIVHEIY